MEYILLEIINLIPLRYIRMEKFNINRRQFLTTASASLALSVLGNNGLDIIFAEEPLRVGLIGTGWYGKSDLFRLIQVAPVEVVSLCDVDKNMLNKAGELVSQRQKSHKVPRLYGDYRKMLAEKDLDLVLVGSPDHWHALHAIEAMKAGAHVYCQKPISVDVREGEAMLAAARKYNRKVQIGTQRRSTPHLWEAREKVLNAGLLGKISHVEMCCYYHMRANVQTTGEPIPDYLDYDMWTGPAPMRPYEGLPHTRWWRAFNEYGNGIVGDMCVHMFDTARWLLNLGFPKRISSHGGIYVQKGSKSNIADTQTAVFEYDEMNLIWQHRTWGTPVDPDYPWALKIFGEKGTLAISTMRADFTPVSKDVQPMHFDVLFEREQYPEDLTEDRIELNAAPATRRQMLDLLKAIQTGSRPVADIEEGYISTASCILANISMDLGRPLVYDTVKKKVVGDKTATKRLTRGYRSPWEHPDEHKV
mgnify:CR=1 FL=1